MPGRQSLRIAVFDDLADWRDCGRGAGRGTTSSFRFAKQAGCSHIVAHLVNYFAREPRIPGATSRGSDWGVAAGDDDVWSYGSLRALRQSVEAEGLELAAIENFDPAHWHDVLLDGPRKQEQLERLKDIVRNVGRAGIPCIGYNFSIAGVWGHVVGPFARGGAESVGFSRSSGPEQTAIPLGHVWNMVYDRDAPAGTLGTVTTDQLWQRLADFLHAIVPVAEEAGVRLAAHPDDPPMPTLRGTARLVHEPHLYQKLLDLVPSHANALEFCQGSIAEMAGGDVYEAIETYASQGAIAYVHFRNVRGKVPEYHEVFLDEGDVDMLRALRLYKRHGFDGVVIPDHTPQMECAAPWHAGMAFALGYMRAALRIIEEE